MTPHADLDAEEDFFGPGATFTIHVPLIKMLAGDWIGAAVLEQLVYFRRNRPRDADGWFELTNDELCASLLITIDILKPRVKHLEELGLVEARRATENPHPKQWRLTRGLVQTYNTWKAGDSGNSTNGFHAYDEGTGESGNSTNYNRERLKERSSEDTITVSPAMPPAKVVQAREEWEARERAANAALRPAPVREIRVKWDEDGNPVEGPAQKWARPANPDEVAFLALFNRQYYPGRNEKEARVWRLAVKNILAAMEQWTLLAAAKGDKWAYEETLRQIERIMADPQANLNEWGRFDIQALPMMPPSWFEFRKAQIMRNGRRVYSFEDFINNLTTTKTTNQTLQKHCELRLRELKRGVVTGPPVQSKWDRAYDYEDLQNPETRAQALEYLDTTEEEMRAAGIIT